MEKMSFSAKAKAELSECDLTELNNFDKDVKKIIEDRKSVV